MSYKKCLETCIEILPACVYNLACCLLLNELYSEAIYYIKQAKDDCNYNTIQIFQKNGFDNYY